MMKAISIALLAGATSVLVASCGGMKGGKSTSTVPGTWQSTPIEINGDCTDWPSPYPNYDAKSMVAYATSNDKEHLYITMQTGDPLTQIKILKQGMTVSIDVHGKKEPSYHINFPLQNDNDVNELFNQGGGKDDGPMRLSRQADQKLKKSVEDCNQLSLEGFATCTGGYMVSQELPCGIKVRMNIDEYKQLVWEAVVPFKAISSKESINAEDGGKPISVCFSIKGFKNTAKGSNPGAAPMGGGMGGGMGAGGMGGGMGNNGRMNSMPMGGGTASGSGGQNPMAHLYESTKTWKFFSIVWKQ